MVNASECTSEDPGFDPLPGQGEGQFFVLLSFRVISCADFFVPEPPFVCTACTQIRAHVIDPISICPKRVGLTAGRFWKHENTAHRGGKKLVSAEVWLLAFPP